MARLSFMALLVLAALSVCATARADATADARAAYDEGAKAYDAKDFATAATRFALADEKVPSGRALELAMASALLANDAPLGMDLVVRAERRAVDGSLAALAAKLKKRFEDGVGRVVLVCAKAHPCTGDLEGRALVAGFPRHATPGPHVVGVTSDDGTKVDVTIAIVRGGEVTVNAPGPVEPPPRVALDPVKPPPPPPAGGLSPAYFGVAAGLGAVGLGTAIGLTVMTSGLHDDFRTTPSRATSDAGNEAQTAARVMWGVAGALAATSVVLFVLTDFGGHEEAKATVAVGPGHVAIAGRF